MVNKDFDYYTSAKRTFNLVESMFKSKFVHDHKSGMTFLKEDVTEKEAAKFIFCLQEAQKYVPTFNDVVNILNKNSKESEKTLKNRIEKSNNSVIKSILTSNGDISKVDIIVKVRRLLTISLDINSRFGGGYGANKLRMREYNNAAQAIIDLMDLMMRYRSSFSKLIKGELAQAYEKQFYHQLYVNIVLFIQIYGNALYSLGIQQYINPSDSTSKDYLRNVNKVQVVFSYDSQMDEPMSIINAISTMIRNGTIFTTKSANVTEQFMELANNETPINEGFIDVVTSLVTNTWIGQILMIPVYIVRSVTYLVLFLGASYSAINDSISRNIEYISDKDGSNAEEFQSYKEDVEDVARHSISQLNNSQMAIKHEIEKNRKEINDLGTPPTSNATPSTAIMI